jgi:REP element-mobilizing transposase RayT
MNAVPGTNMSRLKHVYEPGMTYLITTITRRRERLFEDTRFACIAHEDIAFYAHKFGMISVAHAIMPDHLHWVMHPSREDFARFAREEQAKGKRSKYGHAPERFYLSKIMEDYKRHTAHVINELRDAPYAEVWQEGFRDDALCVPDAIRGAVQYVILNPVKAGLVERSENYPYLAWNADWLK